MSQKPIFAFDPDDPTDTWGQCYRYFLQSIYDRSSSQKSLSTYQGVLDLFFRQEPQKYPDQYTRADIENFLRRSFSPFKLRPSAATMNTRLTALSSFYRYAETYLISDAGHLTPLFATHPPTRSIPYRKGGRVSRAFSFEEMERFFNAIPDTGTGLRDRALFLTFFWTARRVGEIQRLNYGDIERGIVIDEAGHNRQAWTYRFTGKGQGGAEDSEELPEPAKQAIDAYLLASGRLDTIQPGDPLFITTKHHTRMSYKAIQDRLKRHARAAGLDTQRLSLHSWRHTAAQQRYAAGEDIRSLQRLLRHSNISTTDIYLRGLISTADPGAALLIEKFKKFSDPR